MFAFAALRGYDREKTRETMNQGMPSGSDAMLSEGTREFLTIGGTYEQKV